MFFNVPGSRTGLTRDRDSQLTRPNGRRLTWLRDASDQATPSNSDLTTLPSRPEGSYREALLSPAALVGAWCWCHVTLASLAGRAAPSRVSQATTAPLRCPTAGRNVVSFG